MLGWRERTKCNLIIINQYPTRFPRTVLSSGACRGRKITRGLRSAAARVSPRALRAWLRLRARKDFPRKVSRKAARFKMVVAARRKVSRVRRKVSRARRWGSLKVRIARTAPAAARRATARRATARAATTRPAIGRLSAPAPAPTKLLAAGVRAAAGAIGARRDQTALICCRATTPCR